MQLGLDRPEVGFNLPRLGLAGGREVVKNRLLKSVASAEITEHPCDEDSDRAKQDEDQKQLCS